MVYCGKPSKGCKNCRGRKIRCDQEIPACGQCLKANKVCPGYRNQLDLAFRNESDSVIQKAKAKSNKRDLASTKQRPPHRTTPPSVTPEPTICDTLTRKYPPSASFDLDIEGSRSTISLDDWTPGLEGSIPYFPLLPTSEELGINYFVTNYVSEASGPSHGYFNYVSDLCRQEGIDDTLRSSMSACGLARFANTNKLPELLGQARREYMVALRNINSALQCPAESIKNSTLLSIMVLTVFENITGGRQFSLKAWTEHVNGAATILQLRGRSQLESNVGLALFIHVTSHLLISCVQREIPMPQQLRELRREAFSTMPMDPAYQFLKLMDEFTVFRAALKDGEISDHETIIATALRFDGDIMRIFSDVPSGWLYETVYNDYSIEMAYNGSYDIYYDVWIAQIWNAMRLCRIILNENIRTRILQGFTSIPPTFTTAEFTAQFQISTDVLIEMRDGILRSVPQHVGHVTRKPFTQISSPTNDYCSISFTELLNDHSSPTISSHNSPQTFPHSYSAPGQPAQATGGHFLLWPLYVSGITRVSTPESRELVYKRLRYIGDEMGIMQGTALADFLEAGIYINEQESLKNPGGSMLVKPSMHRWRGIMKEGHRSPLKT